MQIMVYHAPKIKELQISGMEGVVKNIVKKYKGKETSANLPYRIEFQLEKDDGKTQKFFVHVVSLCWSISLAKPLQLWIVA